MFFLDILLKNSISTTPIPNATLSFSHCLCLNYIVDTYVNIKMTAGKLNFV